jgi:hypothetical protein
MSATQRTHSLWAAALGAVVAALTVHPFSETDVYWHLALGRAVLQHHGRVVPEPMAIDWAGATCVASEWLWEVVASLLHTSPGAFGLLTALTALCGAASAVLVVALCRAPFRDSDEAPGLGALSLASALALSLVLSRLRLRPESAVMVILPAFALLALRHARAIAAADAFAWRWGAAAVALEVVWAQVHPSFLIAPVTWGALMLPLAIHALRDRTTPDARRTLTHLAVISAALVLGLATSAHGFGIVTQWRLHAGGDAVRHIGDMQAPPAAFFDPRETTYGIFYAALLAAGLGGMLAARRVFVRESVLALAGAALVATAVRGVGPAAILAAPFAARGLHELGELLAPKLTPRLAPWVGVALALGVLAASAQRTHTEEGPLGAIGPRAASMPHASARFLARTAPRGTPVLTSFLSGAPLGYWLHGNVRTLIDSRTPMHFGDADYGRARDLWRVPRALDLAVARYGFPVAVADRMGPECALLAAHPAWRPVVAEASFTTFVRVGTPFEQAPPLTRIAPCGSTHLTPTACEDRGAALSAEIARLRSLGARQADGFYGYLDALRVVRCGVEGVPVGALLARLPSRREAWVFHAQRDRVEATILASQGDVDEALELVADDIRKGDLESLAAVLEPATRQQPAQLRALLRALTRALDDNTPGDVRAELAARCAEAGDAECARFEGLRAAIHGSPRAGSSLCWLAARHPLPHVRRDAAGWLQTLRRALPDDPRLRCEGR